MGTPAIPAFLLHDMGNAVHVIAAVAHTLGTMRDQLDDDEMTAIVETLGRQSATLARLVGDLGDHQRSSAEGLSLRMAAVPLGDAVRAATSHLGHGRAHVHVPDGLTVHADPDRLQQVIGNLVTNAQVHGGPSLWVDTVTRGDRVLLSVSDDGPGLEPTLVTRAFEPFQRGRAAAERPGTGLGLALARRLATAFGGDLRYRRRPGGAQFVLELVLTHAPVAPPVGPVVPPPPFDHSAVVYVADAELEAEVAAMVADGLASADSVLLVITPEHERGVRDRLPAARLAIAEARGQLVVRDALTTLRRFDDGTTLDPSAFDREVGGLVADLEGRFGHVRVFGEMVALQSAAGDVLGALELETLWGELYTRHDFALLCGYPVPAGGLEDATFRPVHDRHGHVFAAPTIVG